MRKQRGNAAIILAMCLPVLFGIFAMGTDGARALQAKARLEDAAEVASLAVAARNDENRDDDTDSGSAVNKEIAGNYIRYYMGNYATLTDVKIKRFTCEEIDDCLDGLEEDRPRFFEYQVTGHIQYDSWFPRNGPIIGFGEQFDVAGFAKARKYQSKAVDVLFVVDFSGSMNWPWDGGSQSRINDLFDILQMVTDELQKFNELDVGYHNRVALTGYNEYQRGRKNDFDNQNCVRDQRIVSLYTVRPEYHQVDYQATINQQFNIKPCFAPFAPIYNNADARYTDISYTDDFDSFHRNLDYFHAEGGTASYQGIIRAGQMATKKRSEDLSPRQLIIILSDGNDNDHVMHTSRMLVDMGMCTRILNKLNNLTTEDKEKVQGKMAVIGFGYNPYQNTALRDCVGEENVYRAQDKEQILDQILALITEEIGHLA
ncbi:pilus assembly protein [Vibrio sp. JC009]|uniref:TadE/TadG family type IV pilus assembly protein n=1 Tax=Vibrio sp. JC009 TaxID=2912314 RepID=UPI0023AF109D|nr:TadE/TadG family type IV pilus assembly protein [Vibrio sp. JC009]WED22306.1 pilus assembly protein [Vibrio sp. JC009]